MCPTVPGRCALGRWDSGTLCSMLVENCALTLQDGRSLRCQGLAIFARHGVARPQADRRTVARWGYRRIEEVEGLWAVLGPARSASPPSSISQIVRKFYFALIVFFIVLIALNIN